MDYDLELNKIIEKIKKTNSKLICIQLPDGLKPYANKIQIEIEKNTNSEVVIWAGSCFGACDIPLELKNFKFDLLIQFGHSKLIR